jgi:hypothetical protein
MVQAVAHPECLRACLDEREIVVSVAGRKEHHHPFSEVASSDLSEPEDATTEATRPSDIGDPQDEVSDLRIATAMKSLLGCGPCRLGRVRR